MTEAERVLAAMEPTLARIARRAARRHPRAHAMYEDLMQEARLAVFLAVPRLEPGRDPKAFLSVRARGAVVDHLRRYSSELGFRGGQKDVRGNHTKEKMTHVARLDAPRGGAEKTLDPRDPAGERLQDLVEVRDEVEAALRRVPPKDRALVLLSLSKVMSMEDVGHLVGVSESRVCQRVRGAARAIREARRADD